MTRYRAAKKYGKMALVLMCICGALLLIRWAAMIWA
ncbi:small membrane protein YniD [Pantoea sp. WMus005]